MHVFIPEYAYFVSAYLLPSFTLVFYLDLGDESHSLGALLMALSLDEAATSLSATHTGDWVGRCSQWRPALQSKW